MIVWYEEKRMQGDKEKKQHITITSFVASSGKKEKPVIIWKSKNPRCLKRFDVQYYKAWIHAKIMESLLTKLNYQFIKEKT